MANKERASVNQVVQIAPEVTSGTAVITDTRLRSMSFSPSFQVNIDQFRPQGQLYQALTALTQEWAQSSIEGRATYDEIVYPLSSILKKIAPTNPTGGVYLWTFTPSSTGGDDVVAFTIERGDRYRAEQMVYGQFSEFSLTVSRENIQIGGSLIARRLNKGKTLSGNATYILTADPTPPTAGNFTLTKNAVTTAAISWNATPAAVQAALELIATVGSNNVKVTADPTNTGNGTLTVANNKYIIEFIGQLAQTAITLTGTFTGLTASASIAISTGLTGIAPTLVPLKPVLPTHCRIYNDATAAALGTNKLKRAFNYGFRLSDRFAPVWTIDADEESWAALVEQVPTCELTLTVEADEEGLAFVDYYRAGTTRFIRLAAIGEVITAGHNYTLQLDFSGQVSAVGELGDTNNVFAYQITLVAVPDSTWGKTYEFQVKNTTSAL